MFPAYLVRPANYRFEGQDPDEEILLVLRAHPITNIPWIFFALVIFFVPFIIPIFIPFIGFNLVALPGTFIVLLLVINYLLVLVVTFEGFLKWYFNVYIITNKNLIDVDFYSILSKNIDIAPLRNIEDASSSMAGIFSSIFDYGDVFIQTAGTSRNIDFLDIPHPHQVADFILDEVHKIARH